MVRPSRLISRYSKGISGCISLIPQGHQDPDSRLSEADCVLPAACRAHWALVSTSTTLALHPRERCAVRRLHRSRHSRGGARPRRRYPSSFPTDSSCPVVRLPAAVVLCGGCLDELLLVSWSVEEKVRWYVKEEVQMAATAKLAGKQQCSCRCAQQKQAR
jgi:hypothetical protein